MKRLKFIKLTLIDGARDTGSLYCNCDEIKYFYTVNGSTRVLVGGNQHYDRETSDQIILLINSTRFAQQTTG